MTSCQASGIDFLSGGDGIDNLFGGNGNDFCSATLASTA